MDWWVIEYDNKNFDSHTFIERLQSEAALLMMASGGGPFGATVYISKESADKKLRFYFNSKAVSITGVSSLLSRYGAKECSKPAERCAIFAGNHAEPL